MKKDWDRLIDAAKSAIQGERIVSLFMKGGYVATALETDKGNIYTGVNVEAKCGLGQCSERYALYKVFEANKNEKIVRCVCFYRNKVSLPCGACREFFMQYGNGIEDMEILLDLKTKKSVKLKDTMAPWWGDNKTKK